MIINIPLILPILAWVGVALVSSVTASFLVKKLFSKYKNKLGILGMQGAGKTRFLSYLRNIPFVEKNTLREPYESFTYKSGKKEIHIDAGIDLGGVSDYVFEYNKIIKKSDVIFYFFDIYKYLNNHNLIGEVNYKRDCNSRFELVYSGANEKKNIIFLATHIDKCLKDEAKVKSEFFNLIKDKTYSSVLRDTVFIDLTNTNQLNNFINKVFK